MIIHLDMKECICHFKWQKHPFISKRTISICICLHITILYVAINLLNVNMIYFKLDLVTMIFLALKDDIYMS